MIEDIDCIFNGRKRTTTEDISAFPKLSFSALLNILDGAISPEGMVVIMTTNHIDKIDNALKRAGRADKLVEFTYADEYQISELYRKFYTVENGDAKHITQALKDKKMTTADLQKLFMEFPDKIQLFRELKI